MSGDFFSSGRGVGVIGTLIGVVVLGGFGGLGLLVFNSTEVEKQDPKLVIETNKEKIQYFQEKNKTLDQEIAKNRELGDAAATIDPLKNNLQEAVENKKQAEETLQQGSEKITQLNTEWETYKNKYRANERARAVGEKIPVLKTLDGKTYTDLKIAGVDETGLRMQSREKVGGISYQVLPLEMQDRFQFDEKQAIEAKKMENQASLARDAGKDVFSARQSLKKAIQLIEKTEKEIANNKTDIIKKQNEIRSLRALAINHDNEAAAAMSAHESARAKGNTSSHAGLAKKASARARRARSNAEAAERDVLKLNANAPKLVEKLKELQKQKIIIEKKIPVLEQALREEREKIMQTQDKEEE